GGELATLPVEVVPLEDVAEQVGLQELVDDGRKVHHRALDRRAGNPGLVGLARREQRFAGGYGPARFTPRRILDAALLARLDHVHQGPERIEAARKAGVGVKLDQDLLR